MSITNEPTSLVSSHRFTEHDLFTSTMNEETPTPLSETVTTLASNVYKELERLIRHFGENSVKDLMPVMISILESLDGALHDRDVSKMENESLKEQNEQLFQQYEKEKSLHKEYQQRYSQLEDHLEEAKRENDEKLSSLESIVKIFEIKARNASDHIGRLEEKENEMKQEYKRLHDRYSELFQTHCDYMERMKILHGTEIQSKNEDAESLPISSNDVAVNTGLFTKLRSLNLLNVPFDEQQFFNQEDEFETNNVNSDPNASDDDDEPKTENTNEIETTSADAFVRQSFYGMTKEVSNLIKENNELLETKNALNVLKDDLLMKIEELSNEQEILREEVESLRTVKQRLQLKISEVEEELRQTRDELEKKKKEEEDVPMADRKRFTRLEMQRVLLERNQYKQRLFDLEEAVHRQNALRAAKQEQQHEQQQMQIHSSHHELIFDPNRTSVWNL